MFDALLTQKQIEEIPLGKPCAAYTKGAPIGVMWKGNSALFKVIKEAQHLATLKAVVRWLFEDCTSRKHITHDMPRLKCKACMQDLQREGQALKSRGE